MRAHKAAAAATLTSSMFQSCLASEFSRSEASNIMSLLVSTNFDGELRASVVEAQKFSYELSVPFHFSQNSSGGAN